MPGSASRVFICSQEWAEVVRGNAETQNGEAVDDPRGIGRFSAEGFANFISYVAFSKDEEDLLDGAFARTPRIELL